MTHVMEQAFQNMSSEMGGKLSHYYQSLQHRFGDLRVYAAQEEQIRTQSAVVEHGCSSTRIGSGYTDQD